MQYITAVPFFFLFCMSADRPFLQGQTFVNVALDMWCTFLLYLFIFFSLPILEHEVQRRKLSRVADGSIRSSVTRTAQAVELDYGQQ